MDDTETAETELDQCAQFICFLDTGTTGDEEQDRYPVGHGATRKEAFSMGLRNALPEVAKLGVYGMAQTGFAIIAQPHLSAEEFSELTKVIDAFFEDRVKLQGTA